MDNFEREESCKPKYWLITAVVVSTVHILPGDVTSHHTHTHTHTEKVVCCSVALLQICINLDVYFIVAISC